ncbi:MAG TPA: glycerol-3-phosphate dehydrogenase/oxidase [Gammaproteobacteria bacterium]|nr:glycerol-3-phosphate dehydrogenase/oxidase [Gammaproteobacteria bacterium]
MRRNLSALARGGYDLLVIGGGIFGGCLAWDAVGRGLRVALIEQRDFGEGVSANSFKMVHGGIRYIQHGDIARVRGSCRERRALLTIAPHLVQPLPIVIPTYGHGSSGRGLLMAGVSIYDLLTADRNLGIRDPARRIPRGRALGRFDVAELFPDLERNGLTGGVEFFDGQMYNPTRLVLAFVRSAAEAGADVANYVEALGFRRNGGGVCGVRARDMLSGEAFDIDARMVINATGPWAEPLLKSDANLSLAPVGRYSRDLCMVVRRRPRHGRALAVQTQTRDPDAIVSRSGRHLFIVPWREFTLVGVWHRVFDAPPNRVGTSWDELGGYIREVNDAYPALELNAGEVGMVNFGLVPFGENALGAKDLSYGKRSRIVDHERVHGVKGLITVIGVRYTMARGEAQSAVDLVVKKLGHGWPRSTTAHVPVTGGDIGDFDALCKSVVHAEGNRFRRSVLRALLHNHGSRYHDVLGLVAENPELGETFGETTVLKAEIVHAIRREAAFRLGDLAFRRTDLATAGDPGGVALEQCAHVAAAELGWSAEQTQVELDDVRCEFPFRTKTSDVDDRSCVENGGGS